MVLLFDGPYCVSVISEREDGRVTGLHGESVRNQREGGRVSVHV